MSIVAMTFAVGSLFLLGIWSANENRLESDAEEQQIREWGSLNARRTAAEIAETEAAREQREELIRTWETLR